MIPILRRVTNGTALFLKEIPEPVKDAAGIFCIIVLFAVLYFHERHQIVELPTTDKQMVSLARAMQDNGIETVQIFAKPFLEIPYTIAQGKSGDRITVDMFPFWKTAETYSKTGWYLSHAPAVAIGFIAPLFDMFSNPIAEIKVTHEGARVIVTQKAVDGLGRDFLISALATFGNMHVERIKSVATKTQI